LQKLTAGLSEKESNDVLNSTISKDPRLHDEITVGLMVAVLVDPPTASRVSAQICLENCHMQNLILCLVALAELQRLDADITRWHELGSTEPNPNHRGTILKTQRSCVASVAMVRKRNDKKLGERSGHFVLEHFAEYFWRRCFHP
jgi:hypothetical protein